MTDTSRNELCTMDAVTMAAEIRARRLSPVEVTQAVLERMERLEPTLHAYCTPTPELAMETARRVEAAIVGGQQVGPLAGVPVAVKDLICTRGIRTVSGSRAYEDFVPDEDDVVVERLKAADAVILGKTNVPEFGYSGVGHNPVFPATRNPWNTELTPGGSSAGSGAAVAAGMGPLALGSDGGGSIRIPSSFCGLYGLKASMGRVPLYPGTKDERLPGVSSWESLEHIGPMTRTVADSALLMSVIAGPDPRDRLSVPAGDVDWTRCTEGGIQGLRVAYSADWGYAAVDARVRAVVDDAVEAFERDLGCTVERVDPSWPHPYEAFWAIVANESDLRGLRAMVERIGADNMTPHVVDFIRTEWTAEQFTDALMVRKAVQNGMWRLMQDHDLLLTPTLAVPPFEVGIQGPEVIDGRSVEPFEWLHFTYPLNFTGQPAASVPAGWTDDGLPVGLQIIGRHLDDSTVLRASAALEAARPWAQRWPGLVSARST
ncbi:MAG TPA: amidase family protein [Geodermatophilus sp.]|nr:amidase family protein [Geodermatophilus sp.]